MEEIKEEKTKEKKKKKGVVLVVLCLLATWIINKLFKTENYEM